MWMPVTAQHTPKDQEAIQGKLFLVYEKLVKVNIGIEY